YRSNRPRAPRSLHSFPTRRSSDLENGGSAFLFVYLAGAFGIGLPLLISELTIGRRGRRSASGSIRAVAAESGASSRWGAVGGLRSEEHTSELQSRENLVCRLLLGK